MIPGKTLKPEDLLQIAKRRALAFLIPAIAVGLVALFVIRDLPNRYRSETLILVVPQRVPESYVRATVTTRIEDRLRSINQQIMSRTRLEPIVREFNLYSGAVKTGLMEDVIEQMRKDIDVQTVRGDAFHISFTADDPRTAMKVTERLASMYIDENLRDREVLADGTNQFLDSQLAAAKARLIEHEKKLEEYKTRNAGELPSQVPSNLQVIQNAQLQIQALVDSISRDKDRRMMLEAVVADASTTEVTRKPLAATDDSSDPTAWAAAGNGTAAEQLSATKKALEEMRLRLKPEHPDVIRMKRVIADLQKKADDEATIAALAPATRPVVAAPVANPAEAARLSRLVQARAEIESLGRQIEQKEEEQARLRGVMTGYQTRVDSAPARESELTELMRDYETLQRSYTSLLSKKEDAQVAANLERHEIGEQFKILDPARMPEKPISPDRPKLYALGAAIGLGFGVLFAGFLEYRDTTLKTDTDVVMTLALPVLALIPPLVTAEERRRTLRWRRRLSMATAGMAAAVGAALVWVLRS